MNLQSLVLFRHLCDSVSSNSWADQVNLNNGDRVTGKLVKKDGDNLTVKDRPHG